MGSSNDQEAYAAASLRERLKDVDLTESKEAYPHAGLVHDEETRRALNLLSVAADMEGVDIRDRQAYQDLLQPAGTETITRAVDAGNVSQMQYAVGLVSHERDGQGLLPQVAEDLAREGCVGLVVGPPGAGKTATALDVTRVWKALTGGAVVSNVPWDGTDDLVTDSEEMLSAMQARQGQVLALIDEAEQSLTSRGSDQARTNALAKDLKLIRKKEEGDDYAKRGSFLGVGHTRKGTAAEIRRLASVVIEKPSRRDPGRAALYSSPGGQDSLDHVADYKGLTDTAEEYDQHDPSPFRVILENNDGDDEDQEAPEDVDRDRQVETVLRAVLVQDQNYREAAELVDFSDTWVGDRVREWKRGDWRDLVSESAVPDENATA